MDEGNPLDELPAELLEEMTPGQRLAFLVHEGEPVPDEVGERARQAYPGRDETPPPIP